MNRKHRGASFRTVLQEGWLKVSAQGLLPDHTYNRIIAPLLNVWAGLKRGETIFFQQISSLVTIPFGLYQLVQLLWEEAKSPPTRGVKPWKACPTGPAKIPAGKVPCTVQLLWAPKGKWAWQLLQLFNNDWVGLPQSYSFPPT